MECIKFLESCLISVLKNSEVLSEKISAFSYKAQQIRLDENNENNMVDVNDLNDYTVKCKIC